MALSFRSAQAIAVMSLLIVNACSRGSEDSSRTTTTPTPADRETQEVPGPTSPPAAPPAPDPTASVPQNTFSEGRARTEDEKNTIEVFKMAAPSTAFVTQRRVVVDYWAGTATEVPAGTGSGFVWDKQGHIVTNYHVIAGARSVAVTLHNHQTFDAEIVGDERRKDIAVLRLVDPPKDLVPIRIREKVSRIEVGQKAIAIGNPFGLDQTLTTGIVSALGREVLGVGKVTIRDMVQTDAAINPGNSGGPLLDSTGHLIGMNTMIYSRSGASAGIGFAVPVSAIKRVVPQIIETGHAVQVGLGVQIDPSQRLEQRLRLRGVIILGVMPNGPAAKAGLRGARRTVQGIELGDVIVGINEYEIIDYDDLYNTLDRYKPGDVVNLTVMRGKRRLTVKLPLIELRSE